MKDFAIGMNLTIATLSVVGVIGNLIAGWFGIAWICVIPLVISIVNLLALDSLENK